jgi:hypothetical protein
VCSAAEFFWRLTKPSSCFSRERIFYYSQGFFLAGLKNPCNKKGKKKKKKKKKGWQGWLLQQLGRKKGREDDGIGAHHKDEAQVVALGGHRRRRTGGQEHSKEGGFSIGR